MPRSSNYLKSAVIILIAASFLGVSTTAASAGGIRKLHRPTDSGSITSPMFKKAFVPRGYSGPYELQSFEIPGYGRGHYWSKPSWALPPLLPQAPAEKSDPGEELPLVGGGFIEHF
jgi:hypothetical protein